MNYDQYVARLRTMIASQAPDADFDTIFPAVVDSAEQKIYRDLDFLNTVVRNGLTSCTAGNRNFQIPAGFVVVQAINVVTPTGSNADAGIRNALTPVSQDYINVVWPETTTRGVPKQFAMVTDHNIIFGPTPDNSYVVEVIGTTRPAPISASNPTTYISDTLPDLFLAASMVFASGYQKNFSAMSDDAGMSMSWDKEYQKLLASAAVEEARRKFMSSAWAAQSPAPFASPPRG